MKTILCVGLLCILGCGGEAFSVAGDGGTTQLVTLSPEAGAADDGQVATPEDPDAGAGAQDAGIVLLEDAAVGEDAHPVMTMTVDAGVDAGKPVAVCCDIGNGNEIPSNEAFNPCGGDAAACILGNGCEYFEMGGGGVFIHGTFVVCPP